MSKNKIDLSICIPTYNRKNELKLCIDSIKKQSNKLYKKYKIEICISDNNSSDGTEEYIRDLIEKGEDIKFNKNNKNVGADLNYLECMKMGQGEYILLMGSDDILNNNCLEIIREIIASSSPDIIISNRVEIRGNSNKLKYRNWLKNKYKEDFSFLTSIPNILDYVNSLNSIGGLFSYLGSIAYKRNTINININEDEIRCFNGTAYIHAYIFIRNMMEINLKFYRTKKSFAICNIGQESFLINPDYRKRIYLDYEGYSKIAKYLNFDFRLYSSLLRLCSREQSIGRLAMYMKSMNKINILNKDIRYFLKCKIKKMKLFIGLILGVLLKMINKNTISNIKDFLL